MTTTTTTNKKNRLNGGDNMQGIIQQIAQLICSKYIRRHTPTSHT